MNDTQPLETNDTSLLENGSTDDEKDSLQPEFV